MNKANVIDLSRDRIVIHVSPFLEESLKRQCIVIGTIEESVAVDVD